MRSAKRQGASLAENPDESPKVNTLQKKLNMCLLHYYNYITLLYSIFPKLNGVMV